MDGPCALARANAGLTHTYIAIVSVTGRGAKERVTGDQKIYKVTDGRYVLVANNAEQMWSGTPRLEAPIDTDENGVQHTTTNLRAWTGSTALGALEAGRSCDDWTNAAQANGGSFGHFRDTNQNWIRSGNSVDCAPATNIRGVYCISI